MALLILGVFVSRTCCSGPKPGRLNLAEKLKAPWRRGKRPDPSQAAAREASRLELEEGANAPLGFTVKMMLIGLTGECVEHGVCAGRCGEAWGMGRRGTRPWLRQVRMHKQGRSVAAEDEVFLPGQVNGCYSWESYSDGMRKSNS